MPVELRFSCPLANGLHARPASLLADVVRPFRSRVTISRAGAAPADVLSVLSVVGLDVKAGQECILCADGDDASDAMRALRVFVYEVLPSVDAEVPSPAGMTADAAPCLPTALRRLNVAHAVGKAVCGGIGFGSAVMVSGLSLSPEANAARPGALETELRNTANAIDLTRDDLERRAATSKGLAGDVLQAHAAIAGDPALRGYIEERVRQAATAAQAVVAAAGEFASRLRAAESAYVRDRALDVMDVCMQILDRLPGGAGGGGTAIGLTSPSVVFADALTANQLLRLDLDLLRGLVLGSVGATSHTVILARSFQIPTVIDVRNAPSLAGTGASVIVDGEGGLVFPEPSAAVHRYFDREERARQRLRARVCARSQGEARTTDGAILEVGVNASTPAEVERVISGGADGVGLLRTELLFLDRAQAPTEEEQFQAYAAVVRAASGKPVIIRTFDIGGDKPATYLHLAKEENPFLGVRGLRLYRDHPEVLSAQLRAILRAAGAGPVKIMAPMVATPEEVTWFRERVEQTRTSLAAEGVPTPDHVPVGIMLEVPAVAMVMDQLCPIVDFFSIGTNDLCQYWMAVDRGNPAVASLYNARQPSFLRLLRAVVKEARDRGRWIGVCGEMAGRCENLPLMLGLGVDEISVAPGEVAVLKSLIRDASGAQCKEALARACECASAADVDALLETMDWRTATVAPIVDRQIITVDSDSQSKEEVIQEAVGLLYACGRVDRPRVVEEAVWAREATYSTGLGFGFAIPHCKSESVTSPSLAIVRLGSPVEWGSLDGQPVAMVLLLVVPSADSAGSHMKVFAKLARRLMHEEFRGRLMAGPGPDELCAYLRDELDLA